VHCTGLEPWQLPPWQEKDVWLQLKLPEQLVPLSGFGSFTQPVCQLQESTVQELLSLQDLDPPPEQNPLLQKSFTVQALPSSQLEVFALWVH
jgi:hypothetical protein